MKDKSLPRKLLGAWVPSARTPGHPQSNLKDNFIQALKIGLKGDISDEATFREWLPIAADEKRWNTLVEDHFKAFCKIGDDGNQYAQSKR